MLLTPGFRCTCMETEENKRLYIEPKDPSVFGATTLFMRNTVHWMVEH